MIERVNHRLIQSGDITEVYTYEDGYLRGFTKTKNTGSSKNVKAIEDIKEPVETEIDLELKIENRERALRRAKQGLRRTINSNYNQYQGTTSKFLTLTFAENITDIDVANKEFRKFMRRLNYRAFNTKKTKLKYTGVIEFQQRGAIHYHIILYNMPFIDWKEILEIWENGSIDIRKIDDVDNVGAYVAEYLGSQNKGQGASALDDRLDGRKSYFSSRGLFKPTEITNKEIIESIVNSLPKDNLVYSAEYDNEYLGFTTYKQFNLNRNNKLLLEANEGKQRAKE